MTASLALAAVCGFAVGFWIIGPAVARWLGL